MPTQKLETASSLHPWRLPLGTAWGGYCCAPGHQSAQPSDEELLEFCNLGYAAGCSRLPKERACDAVRFAVAREGESQILLGFVCEANHRPAGHGTLEYDRTFGRWISSHSDARIQKMAECFLQCYLLRKGHAAATALVSSDPHESD